MKRSPSRGRGTKCSRVPGQLIRFIPMRSEIRVSRELVPDVLLLLSCRGLTWELLPGGSRSTTFVSVEVPIVKSKRRIMRSSKCVEVRRCGDGAQIVLVREWPLQKGYKLTEVSDTPPR